MKYRLFVKEFIGSKKKMFFFSLMVAVLLVIVGVIWIDLIANDISGNEADVVLCGQRDERSYGYKLYDPIPDLVEAAKIMDEKSVRAVPGVSRCIISIQSGNSLNKVMCTVKGYEEGFIRDQLVFARGRAPECNAKEVALGSYLAQMLNVSVGDVIGEGTFEFAGYDQVGIALTLDDNLDDYKKEGYTVVGILDENLNDLNYSFLVPYSEDDASVIPNTLELYFREDTAIDSYRAFIDACRQNHINIASVSERFVIKKNLKNQMLASTATVLLFSVSVIYLLLAYLSKGIGKKLGLLKSFGIKNSTIIKIFAGGLSVLAGISFLTSLILVNVICSLKNKQMSDFLGIAVNKYVYAPEVYLIQLGLGGMFVLCVWGIIFWRIKTTSPNVCMMK